jgi:hypothetical protein
LREGGEEDAGSLGPIIRTSSSVVAVDGESGFGRRGDRGMMLAAPYVPSSPSFAGLIPTSSIFVPGGSLLGFRGGRELFVGLGGG